MFVLSRRFQQEMPKEAQTVVVTNALRDQEGQEHTVFTQLQLHRPLIKIFTASPHFSHYHKRNAMSKRAGLCSNARAHSFYPTEKACCQPSCSSPFGLLAMMLPGKVELPHSLIPDKRIR